MSSAARLFLLLELLQSAPSRTMTELADRLVVDERTVRRDVRRLVDLDIPVESVRGRYGGYRLTAGRHVPPLVLSADEATAVVASIVRARATSREHDEAAHAALSKIRRVLPAQASRRVAALLGDAAVTSAGDTESPDGETLLTLVDGVASRQTVEIAYRDADGARSLRTLHPLRVVEHAGRWYLAAHDVTLRAERTFRIDRIDSVRQTGTVFPEPEARPTADDLVRRFAQADYPWHVVLHVHATEALVRSHLPRAVATVAALDVPPEDEVPWHRVEIRAKSLEWLPPVIAAIGADVRVERPTELRDLLEAAATRLRHAARPPGTPPWRRS
ncbi:MAG: helix-turn-helix transcriptional regulator [Cellulosimicrobium cellulans]